MVTKTISLASCLALGIACGGGASTNTSTPASTQSDVTAYESLATNVQVAANDYAAAMVDATLATCPTMHDDYDGKVRPWIDRMMQMSAGMDELMAEHGGTMMADMGCSAEWMMAELDRHRGFACTYDLPGDELEVQHHVEAMLAFTEHVVDRCREIDGGMMGGPWSFGPMMSGCASPDGGMMHDGGMMMHDGGMMGH